MKLVKLTTSLGNITLELDDEKAPLSVANFLSYVDKGFYTDTIFHRVIRNFMIQGGGFEAGLKSKATEAAIANEAKNGLQNKKFTIAMARTSAPHSATAQFFINTVDNNFLDNGQAQDGWGYAVFGKVIEGQDVVTLIGQVATGRQGLHDDVPKDDVVIQRAEQIEQQTIGAEDVGSLIALGLTGNQKSAS